MAFDPIVTASDSEYSRGATLEIGVTTDDAAGQVYVETTGRVYLTAAKAEQITPAVRAAVDQAKADALIARVSLRISVAATDQEIVDAVRALLGPAPAPAPAPTTA